MAREQVAGDTGGPGSPVSAGLLFTADPSVLQQGTLRAPFRLALWHRGGGGEVGGGSGAGPSQVSSGTASPQNLHGSEPEHHLLLGLLNRMGSDSVLCVGSV